MGFVQKAVARLDQPEKLSTLLNECGKQHHYYGAIPNYVDVSISSIIYLYNKPHQLTV